MFSIKHQAITPGLALSGRQDRFSGLRSAGTPPGGISPGLLVVGGIVCVLRLGFVDGIYFRSEPAPIASRLMRRQNPLQQVRLLHPKLAHPGQVLLVRAHELPGQFPDTSVTLRIFASIEAGIKNGSEPVQAGLFFSCAAESTNSLAKSSKTFCILSS